MSFTIPSVSHDPDEVLDYEVNWRVAGSPVLQDGEDIASSTWAIDGMRTSASSTSVVASDGAMTVSTFTVNADVTKCWVQGGTLGKLYLLRNRITTTSTPARTHDRSRWLVVERH